MSHAETALACQVSYQVKEVREEKAKLTQIISESRNHAPALPVLLYLEVASDCPCSTQSLRPQNQSPGTSFDSITACTLTCRSILVLEARL